MPGPQNTKRKKKQQAAKEKVKAKKTILAEVQQNVAQQPTSPAIDYENQDEIVYLASRRASVENKIDPKRRHSNSRSQSRENILLDSTGYSKNLHDTTARSPELWVAEPFITDPGNGPRVKDMRAYLSSFFCPPVTYDDPQCSAFAREEVLGLLEAVLPHEVALILWYNKTRRYARACPSCQRLYRLGDALLDPLSGFPLDVRSPHTLPQVLAEQELSGICSQPCFMLAAYSSHPYVAEIVRGAWGCGLDALDAHTRSLLDSTDPRSAALLRYGLAAWDTGGDGTDMGDQGLGCVLRLTRMRNLGLGEVLEALAWHDSNKRSAATVAPKAAEEPVLPRPELNEAQLNTDVHSLLQDGVPQPEDARIVA